MSITAGFVSIVSEKLGLASSDFPARLAKFTVSKPLPMRLASYIDHFLYQLDLNEDLLASSYSILEHFFCFLSGNNVHKFVFTALVIAYKAFTDKPVKNSTLEKIGVLKSGELAELERTMLEEIDWELGYEKIEKITEELTEFGKMEERGEEIWEDWDDETDITESGENESFSELSAFF